MPDHDARYFRELSDRIAKDARHLPFRHILVGSRPPQAGQCHYNAARVAEETGHSVVRGWLIDTSASRLVAHSVVEDDKGQLYEIATPHTNRFIRHLGSQELFEQMREKYPAIYFAG